MKSSKYKRLFSDTLIFAIGTIGSKLIVFFLLPIYTNALSSEEYGVADYIVTLSEIIRPFVSLAIYNALLRYGLSKNENKEAVVTCTVGIFVAGTIITILITPFFGFYSTISNWKWYLSLYVVAVFLHKISMIFLKVVEKNKLYAVMSIVQAAITATISILTLVTFDLGIRGYLISNIFGYVVVSVLAVIFGKMYKYVNFQAFDSLLMKKMVSYSLPFIANDISWFFIHSSDKFMIEKMMDLSALGLYSAAVKIPLMVTVISSIFSQAWSLAIVREYEGDNDKKYFNTVFNYYSICVCGVTIGLISIIKPFMSFYVGEEFYAAWKYVPLLTIATMFSIFASFFESFYSAYKKSSAIMISTSVAAITNIIVNYIGIKQFGVFGAVIGTFMAYLVLMVIRLKGAYKNFGFTCNIHKFIMMLILTLVQAVIISEDYYGSATSFIIGVLYFILIRKELFNAIDMLKTKINLFWNRKRK